MSVATINRRLDLVIKAQDQVTTSSCIFRMGLPKTNKWDPHHTTSFAIYNKAATYEPPDTCTNWCLLCCPLTLPLWICNLICLASCCSNDAASVFPSEIKRPQELSDAISEVNWDVKIQKISEECKRLDVEGNYECKKAYGIYCYDCCYDDLYSKNDERGYGSFVNFRKKEIFRNLSPFVEKLSDDQLIWSLEWCAAYPAPHCLSTKDEVDQLKNNNAWTALKSLPTGFSVTLNSNEKMPIEQIPYQLQVVVRRKRPKADFLMPEIKIDASDYLLPFLPGFEFLGHTQCAKLNWRKKIPYFKQ